MWWPDSALFLHSPWLSAWRCCGRARKSFSLPLRHSSLWRHVRHGDVARRVSRCSRRHRRIGPDVFRLADDSRRSPFTAATSGLMHHIACRGTGGASRCLRPTGRRCRSADDLICLGHVVAAFRRQHRGAPAAHADRIYRPAFRSPADRLSGDDRNDHRADAPRREPQAGHRPGCELKRRPGPQFLQTCDSFSLTGCAPCR